MTQQENIDLKTIQDILPFVRNLIMPGNVAFFPKKVEEAILRAVEKQYGKGWKSNKVLVERLNKKAKELSLRYRYKDKNPDYYDEDSYIYSIYYLPKNFHKVQLMIIDALVNGWHLPEHLRVLDLGSATGTTALAIADFVELLSRSCQLFGMKNPVKQVTIVSCEKNNEHIDVFKDIMVEYEPDTTVPIKINCPLNVDLVRQDIKRITGDTAFDLIVVSNILNEIEKQKSGCSREIIEKLKAMLAKESMMFIIEPAYQECERNIKGLMNHFSQKGACFFAANPIKRKEALSVPGIMRPIEDKAIIDDTEEYNDEISILLNDRQYKIQNTNSLQDEMTEVVRKYVDELNEVVGHVLNQLNTVKDVSRLVQGIELSANKLMNEEEAQNAIKQIKQEIDRRKKEYPKCRCGKRMRLSLNRRQFKCDGYDENAYSNLLAQYPQLRMYIHPYGKTGNIFYEDKRTGKINPTKYDFEDTLQRSELQDELKREILKRYHPTKDVGEAGHKTVDEAVLLEKAKDSLEDIIGKLPLLSENKIRTEKKELIKETIKNERYLVQNEHPNILWYYTIMSKNKAKIKQFTKQSDIKEQCKAFRMYFKKKYARVIEEYDRGMEDGLLEADIDKKRLADGKTVQQYKEEFEYFLKRIRPDIDEFRQGQFNIISRVLSGQNLLSVMATGSGKSLCFQLPAMLIPGVSIVISPLKALMSDQVRSMQEKGFFSQVVKIDGDLEGYERKKVLDNVKKGLCKLLYLTPEQMNKSEVVGVIKTTKETVGINYLFVDEAHCISQWGHDFRPDYMAIERRRREVLDGVSLALFTATASDKVNEDIEKQYQVDALKLVRSSFYRKDICIRVIQADNIIEKIKQLLSDTKNDEKVLIYTPKTKKKDVGHDYEYAEDLSARLNEEGYSAGWFHSNDDERDKKLFEREKKRAIQKFREGRLKVICATKAFGMGIDIPDIKMVIHVVIPESLEDYYQQIGRVARIKGMYGDSVLLYKKLPHYKNDCSKKKCYECDHKKDCSIPYFFISMDSFDRQQMRDVANDLNNSTGGNKSWEVKGGIKERNSSKPERGVVIGKSEITLKKLKKYFNSYAKEGLVGNYYQDGWMIQAKAIKTINDRHIEEICNEYINIRQEKIDKLRELVRWATEDEHVCRKESLASYFGSNETLKVDKDNKKICCYGCDACAKSQGRESFNSKILEENIKKVKTEKYKYAFLKRERAIEGKLYAGQELFKEMDAYIKDISDKYPQREYRVLAHNNDGEDGMLFFESCYILAKLALLKKNHENAAVYYMKLLKIAQHKMPQKMALEIDDELARVLERMDKGHEAAAMLADYLESKGTICKDTALKCSKCGSEYLLSVRYRKYLKNKHYRHDNTCLLCNIQACKRDVEGLNLNKQPIAELFSRIEMEEGSGMSDQIIDVIRQYAQPNEGTENLLLERFCELKGRLRNSDLKAWIDEYIKDIESITGK